MSFTGNEDHSISLANAAVLTKNYRDAAGDKPRLGGFFGKTALESILDQPGCVGLRYYHGLDENDKPVIVLVGVNGDENDKTDGEIAELAIPCPPKCGSSNALNSDD